MARKCVWSGSCRRKKRKSSVWRREDHEKVKLLEISVEDAERWERRKKRKDPDLGFSDYAAAQLHQYHQLTKQIKPDMESHEQQREKDGGSVFSKGCICLPQRK
ncbi:Pre-mRNA-splicing factor SYF2 [Lemmus lemmus]